MLTRSAYSVAILARQSRSPLLRAPFSSATVQRDYEYFDNFEMKDGIGIVRLNGPGPVNTISDKMQHDVDKIFNEHVVGNKDLKGLVFISSKKDNFIAGADIDMIKKTENKADLKEVCMRGHQWWNDIKKQTGIPFVAAINGSALVSHIFFVIFQMKRGTGHCVDAKFCLHHREVDLSGLCIATIALQPRTPRLF